MHGAAHLAGNAAPSAWDIVPDADSIIVMIEPISDGVEKLLRLFSPFPIHLLQPRVQIPPAPGGQPERGAIGAGDLLGFFLAMIAFGFELVNTPVKRFQKIGIVDLSRLAR